MNTLKTLAISAALVVGTLGAASASSLYSSEVEFPGSYIEFGVIVADAPATLALYDYTGGVKGELISTVNIDAGYNSDVRIQTKSITVMKFRPNCRSTAHWSTRMCLTTTTKTTCKPNQLQTHKRGVYEQS